MTTTLRELSESAIDDSLPTWPVQYGIVTCVNAARGQIGNK